MKALPLTSDAFAPFGDVAECAGDAFSMINDDKCKRFTDLVKFDIHDGTLGLSLFQSEIRETPYSCALLERHPLGSQCFVSMGNSAFLVIVAEDNEGPSGIRAFHARPNQIVNIGRNVWHGVLAPISGSGTFAVMDRIGDGTNLEEYPLTEPIVIEV